VAGVVDVDGREAVIFETSVAITSNETTASFIHVSTQKEQR
jgi:hypothetical protein